MDQCLGLKLCGISTSQLYQIVQPINLSWEDVFAVILRAISLEVAFMQGYSVMESIHSFLLMWRRSWEQFDAHCSPELKTIAVFGKSQVKTISRILNIVIQADVYEGKISGTRINQLSSRSYLIM